MPPQDRLPNLEDIWLQPHAGVRVRNKEYRFLYRDLVDILSRNQLKLHFGRMLNRAATSASAVLKGLAGPVSCATADEIRATAEKRAAGDHVLVELQRRAQLASRAGTGRSDAGASIRSCC